jgi:hypothetical protein
MHWHGTMIVRWTFVINQASPKHVAYSESTNLYYGRSKLTLAYGIPKSVETQDHDICQIWGYAGVNY